MSGESTPMSQDAIQEPSQLIAELEKNLNKQLSEKAQLKLNINQQQEEIEKFQQLKNDEIARLKDKINTLESQYKSFANDQRLDDNEINKLSSKLQDKNEKIDSLHRQLIDSQQLVDTLKNEYKNEVNSLNKQIVHMQEESFSLISECNALEKIKHDQTIELSELKQQLKDSSRQSSAQFRISNNEKEELQEKLNKALSESEKLLNQAIHYKETLRINEQRLQEKEKALDEREAGFDQEKNKIILEFEAKFEEGIEQIESLQNDILLTKEEAKIKQLELNTEISTLKEKHLKHSEEQNKKYNELFLEKQADKKRFELEKFDLNVSLENSSKEIAVTRQNLDNSKDEVQHLSKSLAKLKLNLSDKDRKLEALSSEFKDLQADAKKETDELNRSIDTLKTQISDMESEKSTSEQAHEENLQKLLDINTKISAELKNTQSEKVEIENFVSQIQQGLSEKDKRYDELKDEYSSFKLSSVTENRKLSRNINTLNSKINDLETEKSTTAATHEENLQKFLYSNNQLTTELSGLKSEKLEAEEALTKLKLNLSEQNNHYEELKVEYKSLELSAEAEKDGLKQGINSLKSRISELESEKSNLNATQREQTLKNNLLKTELADVKHEKSNYKQKIRDLSQKISTLEKARATAEETAAQAKNLMEQTNNKLLKDIENLTTALEHENNKVFTLEEGHKNLVLVAEAKENELKAALETHQSELNQVVEEAEKIILEKAEKAQNEINHLQQSQETLKGELQQLKEEDAALIEDYKNKLELKNTEAEQILAEYEEQMENNEELFENNRKEWESEKQGLCKEIETFKEEHAGIKLTVNSLTEEKESLLENIFNGEKIVQELRNAKKHLEFELSEIREGLTKEQALRQQLQTAFDKSSLQAEQNKEEALVLAEELQLNKQELNDLIAQYNNLKLQSENTANQLESFEHLKGKLENELFKTNEKLQSQESFYKETIENFQNEIAMMNQSILTLENSLRTRQEQLDKGAQDSVKLQDEISSLEEENTIQKDEINQLKQEIAEERQINGKAREQSKAILQQLNELQSEREALIMDKEKFKKLWKEGQEKELEMEQILPQFKECLSKLNKITNEKRELEKTIEEISQKNMQLKQNNDDWRLKVGELQNSLMQMSDSSRKWENRSRENQNTVSENQDTINNLKQTIFEMESVEQSLRQDLEDFETVQKEHLEELKRYDEEIESKRCHNRQLEEENDRMLRSMNRINSEMGSYQETIREKEEEVRQQRKMILDFKSRISQLVFQEADNLLGQIPELPEEGEVKN